VSRKHTVLFVCTGNSCRSQMAEAITNHRFTEQWQAESAGTRLKGFIHPLALRALAEIGINHQGRSKSVDEFQHAAFDLVVTVCDSAAEECPTWLGHGKTFHIDLPDPEKATGTDEEVMAVFRSIRDSLITQLVDLLDKGV